MYIEDKHDVLLTKFYIEICLRNIAKILQNRTGEYVAIFNYWLIKIYGDQI